MPAAENVQALLRLGAETAGSGAATLQHVAQHEGVIDAGIARGVQQRDALPPRALAQFLERGPLRAQLRAVTPRELGPAVEIAMQPTA